MGLLEIIFIGVGLSMDASCVSISNGMCTPNLKTRHVLANSIFFGVFQGLMPLIGFYAGSLFVSTLSKYSTWLVILVFTLLGGKMIYDALHEGPDADCTAYMTFRLLLVQAVATSIDALAVGVVFSATQVDIFFAAGLFTIITFILSFAAILLGKKIGTLFNKKAGILGGILLLGIALKTLTDALL